MRNDVTTILVTYATMAGSTAEIAQSIGDTLAEAGLSVDVLPIRSVDDLQGYSAVVVGAPMILGWHREARRFLRRHRSILETIPFAIFTTAMSLTQTKQESVDGIPVLIDEKLAKPPANPARLSFRERYASLTNYIRPIRRAAFPAKPVSIAFFGGRLNYGRLKWWAVLFAMLLVQAQAGDKRNWEVINRWARELPDLLGVDALISG
jgi:menaquinone-dependent protoporphyrinogen oxidase